MFFEPGSMLSEWYCALRYKNLQIEGGQPTGHQVCLAITDEGTEKGLQDFAVLP